MAVIVQAEPFDCGAEMSKFTAGRRDVGAVASFVGLVRERDGDASIDAMTLEHYPGMTEKQLAKIEADARSRWPLQDCLIIHRFGRMEPGEPIVMVLTASPHRAAALDACEFLIDFLKTQAPFWKVEEVGGDERWVDAKASDDLATERWSNR